MSLSPPCALFLSICVRLFIEPRDSIFAHGEHSLTSNRCLRPFILKPNSQVEALRDALRAAGEEREQFTKALEARGGEMRDLEESLEAAVQAQV